MKIIKSFDITLNITDINIIFSKNINDNLLNLISKNYQNKNYLSSYIIKINKILNRSLIESNQNDLNCSFIIYVQFEAECIIYNKDEVVLDMEIQESINNNIIIKNNNIIALIKNNPDLKEFKVGEKIPIRIGRAKYSLGTDKISINSYPFIPITFDIINYKITKISNEDLDLLNDNIIRYIQEEEDIKSNILKNKNNSWNYFKELIYPYSSKSEKPTKNMINLLDCIKNLSKYENKILTFNDKYDLSNRLIEINEINETNYISNNIYLILYDLCKKYYLHLKLINDLSIVYNTKEKISNNKKIFDLYNKYKK